MKRTPLFVLFWLAGCGPTWPNAETDGADAGTDTSTGSSSGATTSLTTIGEPPPDGPCRECRLAVPIEFSTTLRAVEFQKNNLEWEGTASVDFACFPR